MKYLKLFENFDSESDKDLWWNENYKKLIDAIEYIPHEDWENLIKHQEDFDGVYNSTGKNRALYLLNTYSIPELEDIINTYSMDDDLNEGKTNVDQALKNKSEDSGIPVSILRKVYSKGMQAWNAGHRPGVAQHQWGMGRVNSFITGKGGARKADDDLWKKAKAAKDRKKKKK